VTIQADDLATLRIDRNAARRRPWLPWAVLLLVAAGGVFAYPSARQWVDEQRALEVDVARVTQMAAASSGGSAALPVLVATGYVVARHSSARREGGWPDCALGSRRRACAGQIIAEIEHADIDAARRAARIAEAEARRVRPLPPAARTRAVSERQRPDERRHHHDRRADRRGSTLEVSDARVKSAEAAIASARADQAPEALENTNVRAPFDGSVIRKRAEVRDRVAVRGGRGRRGKAARLRRLPI
jgi:multidrug efflux pump subunit AcrA (membrane-fusion protein)